MRFLPVKFGQADKSEYIKTVDIGIIDTKIVIFDGHGDIIDISSPIPSWKIKRVVTKLRSNI